MKLLILTVLSAIVAVTASAQERMYIKEAEPRRDSTETLSLVTFQPGKENPNDMSIRFAGYELLLERDYEGTIHNQRRRNRPYGGRMGILEVGFNGWANTGYSMYPTGEHGFMDLNMGRSFHITVNVFTFSTSFTRNNVLGLTMGIGLTSNDYTFETPSRFQKAGGMIRPVYPDYDLKKAKLHTFALHIPLVIEINPTRNFFISAGGYADLLIKSHLKSKFPKEKLRSPYTNFVQAGITARIGFRNVYIFGNYAFTEVFKGRKGPSANPYTFGLGLGF